jgi:hypothetical protein
MRRPGTVPWLYQGDSMKKQMKKLALSKETISLISASVVGGAITDLCNSFRCPPTDPYLCQTNQKYAC